LNLVENLPDLNANNLGTLNIEVDKIKIDSDSPAMKGIF